MIHGIINIYKEKGYTSHDVVAKLRRIVNQKKIGHTGTLDPDAEGVLPVCFGKGTKLCDLLTDKNKAYEAVLVLGKETDTQDTSGTILNEYEISVSKAEVEEAIFSFIGEYAQIPPMYSALKVNGKKLYQLARAGIEVERKARKVRIMDIQILEIDLPRVRIRVSCSKGTYIRTLMYDIGRKLECGGCLDMLLRTQVGTFHIQDSYKLDEIEKMVAKGEIDAVVTPLDAMFPYPSIVIWDKYAQIAYNGDVVCLEHIKPTESKGVIKGPVKLYNEKRQFIGIYAYDEEKDYYKLVKMFFSFQT